MSSDFQWSLRGRCYKLGDNVPHPGGVIPLSLITARETDPKVLIPKLFSETDPGFSTRCRPGDLIITGKNFGMGVKSTGYIAMAALGLGLLCESMSVQAYREALSTGLRVLSPCPGILELCERDDDVEIDYRTGEFINHTRNLRKTFTPMPPTLQELVAEGGTIPWLAKWWKTTGSKEVSS